MSKIRKASTSQEVESSEKKRETAKPLDELCKVYKYDSEKALDASFANRLKLFRIDGVIYCRTKDFRAYLEEEWKAGRYVETKICTDCGKAQPLCYFSYEGKKQHHYYSLYCHCRYCHQEYQRKIKEKKEAYGDLFDEENQHSDCRVFKSVDEFVGKRFIIETKSEGDVIDFLSMTIENVLSDSETKSVMLAGKDKDGRTCIQKLFFAEVQSLCYEGLSIYWSEKSERLYKKVLILNNN